MAARERPLATRRADSRVILPGRDVGAGSARSAGSAAAVGLAEPPSVGQPARQPTRAAAPARNGDSRLRAAPDVVEFRGVSKVYESGDVGLEGVTFKVKRGEFVFL